MGPMINALLVGVVAGFGIGFFSCMLRDLVRWFVQNR